MLAYLTINTAVELICFLVALLFLFREKAAAWKLFILYLFLMCLAEIGGIYLRKTYHHNSWLYNLFVPAECGMNSYFFYYLIRKFKPAFSLFWYWVLVFTIIYTIELTYRHLIGFVAVTTTVMSVVFVLASIYYYYLLIADQRYVRLKHDAAFWWVNGTMLFYFGSTATNLFFDYLLKYPAQQFSSSVHYIISAVLNILLY